MRTFWCVLALAVSAVVAHAIPQPRISDGTSTVTVSDFGAGDSNPAAGAVTWIGSLGAWSVNVGTGITKPALGYVDLPILNLNL